MQDNQLIEDPEAKQAASDNTVPAIVDAMLVIFYLSVWAGLAGIALTIFVQGLVDVMPYVPPLLLYVALLVSFPVRNWRRFRGGEGKMSDLLWGYNGQLTHSIAFVLVNFALVVWLSSLNTTFANLYLMLFGVSAGLLGRRWKLMWPVVAAELLAFALQSGVWDTWQRSGYNVLDPAVAGFALGMVLFIAYVVMISVLITSRIKSEALVLELKATKSQLEEALQKEKEVAVLRERDRMAREMHDVLGHALVLVAVKIEAAQRLQAVDPERAQAELDATKDLVRQSMADLRTSLADMRSPDPSIAGSGPTLRMTLFGAGSKPLSQALQDWATGTATQGNFSVQCNLGRDVDYLPVPVQDALWRVGREAVLNIVKHARAHNVEMSLFTSNHEAFLTVSDDGVGIPHLVDGTARLEVDGHYGFRGMRERVEALGGRLTVKTAHDGRGTMVIAMVPVPETKVAVESSGLFASSGLRLIAPAGIDQSWVEQQSESTPAVRRPLGCAQGRLFVCGRWLRWHHR